MTADVDREALGAAVETSIQHRCPRMREHHQGGCACHPRLTIPCDECYSIRVTAERLPYEPSVSWHPVTAAVVGILAERDAERDRRLAAVEALADLWAPGGLPMSMTDVADHLRAALAGADGEAGEAT